MRVLFYMCPTGAFSPAEAQTQQHHNQKTRIGEYNIMLNIEDIIRRCLYIAAISIAFLVPLWLVASA